MNIKSKFIPKELKKWVDRKSNSSLHGQEVELYHLTRRDPPSSYKFGFLSSGEKEEIYHLVQLISSSFFPRAIILKRNNQRRKKKIYHQKL